MQKKQAIEKLIKIELAMQKNALEIKKELLTKIESLENKTEAANLKKILEFQFQLFEKEVSETKHDYEFEFNSFSSDFKNGIKDFEADLEIELEDFKKNLESQISKAKKSKS